MRYLSPRAYEYLRHKFGDNLPHTDTIRKWFSINKTVTNGGLINAAFQTLSNIAKECRANGKNLYVALSFDEMAIRRLIQYHHNKKKFSGFINFGTKQFSDEPLPIATNALVVMLNGMNLKVTLPIAYYFVTTLIAEEKSILIASIVKCLTTLGIIVVSVTSDGLSANLAAYEILGASFDVVNMIPFFINPDNGKKNLVFLDPPHTLKLVRNCFGDQKRLVDQYDRPIEWKYVERLYRRKSNDLSSHKLTKRHVDWKSTPMRVDLAVQTLSSSVAQSMKKLSANGVKQFQDCEGTVDFIERFDKSFDILNSDEFVKGNIFKSPINAQTKATVFDFMDEMNAYIDGLSLNGRRITESQRSTGFIGFKSNFMALKIMYEEYVESGLIDKIRVTRIQQDLVESFFGRMRSGNGSNSNPSQEQFVSNFHRTLMNQELACSALSNCIDKLEILQLSSSKKNYNEVEQNFVMLGNMFENEWDDDEDIDLSSDDMIEFLLEPNAEASSTQGPALVITPAEQMGIINVAGLIESLIEKNRKFNCNDCSTLFEINDKIDQHLFVKNKKNVLPCQSTVKICEISHQAMTDYLSVVHESSFDYQKLFEIIKTKMVDNELYTETDFSHDLGHRSFIIDLIIEEYIRIRALKRARLLTINQHVTLIRSAKTHDIHFAGQ